MNEKDRYSAVGTGCPNPNLVSVGPSDLYADSIYRKDILHSKAGYFFNYNKESSGQKPGVLTATIKIDSYRLHESRRAGEEIRQIRRSARF